MEVVVEHGGRRFNLATENDRRAFDEYVNTLPTIEDQYQVNGMALAATDKLLRSFGFY